MKIGEKRAIWKVLIALLFILVWVYGIRITKANPEDPGAALTGVIHDQGIDEDGDGTYDILEIGVEVNVTRAAYYGVELKGLVSSNSSYMDIRPEIYLEPREVGLQVVLIRISGPWIYSFGLNPVNVSSISLRDRDNSHLEGIAQIPLSREYNYIEFDAPGAALTGVMHDQGVDEDGDGTYDFLEIGVEVNVTNAASSRGYEVSVGGFGGGAFGFGASGSAWELGVQLVSVRLDGRVIRSSNTDVVSLPSLSLRDENGNTIWMSSDVPLSRKYIYTEFDPPGAVLTGKIYDRGVDLDDDGTFDQLEVGVEVNVTEAGQYYLSVIESIDVGGYNYSSLGIGVTIVSVSLDGPTIYVSHLNPVNITKLQIWIDRAGYQELSDIPLSHKYFFTEFDKPQVAVGDWAKYTVNATWHSTDPNATEPDQIKEQKDVKWMKIEIQNVSYTITMLQTYCYQNGTETTLEPISGNMKTQFLTYIIPSNLQKGDRIPGGYIPFNPIDEAEGTYAGMTRSLTYANFTMSFFGMNITMKMYWDRSTGILCEMNTTISRQVDSDVTIQSTSTKMTETNLWKIVTQLSCSVLQDTIKEGNSIFVSGSINTDLPGKTVILTYIKPDGSTLNRTVTTGSNGAYSDSYALEAAGLWNVSASWRGDLAYAGSVSLSKSIMVTPKPFFETSLGMATIGVVTFVVVMPVIFFLLRRRKG